MRRRHVRKYPRVPAEFPVDCSTEEKTVHGRAATLGGGGLFVQLPEDFRQGAAIDVRFRPARHLPFLEAKGRICYVIPGKGSGVEFVEISPEQQHLILRLIHHKTANRRKFPRVSLATQIYTQDEMSLAFSRDVSMGGMFIETQTPSPLGTEIDLRFHLNDGEPIVVATAVVKYHVAKLGMGIQFSELSLDDRKRIEAYIARMPALPEPTEP
ncbi:MAG: PilZ domain-containing protein [Terriglobia bacterium]